MDSSNVNAGNIFERQLANKLFKNDFWVYRVPHKTNGQPVDIIAASMYRTVLIDAKSCEKDKFMFSRIEDNQRSSMTLFRNLTGSTGWFALKDSGGNIYMLSLDAVEWLEMNGRNGLNIHEIKTYSISIDEWIDNIKQGAI